MWPSTFLTQWTVHFASGEEVNLKTTKVLLDLGHHLCVDILQLLAVLHSHLTTMCLLCFCGTKLPPWPVSEASSDLFLRWITSSSELKLMSLLIKQDPISAHGFWSLIAGWCLIPAGPMGLMLHLQLTVLELVPVIWNWYQTSLDQWLWKHLLHQGESVP